MIQGLVLLICVMLLGGCSSVFGEWKRAKGKDTLKAYERFLKENPKSAFTDLAEERIKELRWEAAQRANTPESLLEFSTTYPEDALSQKAIKRMQVADWQEAKELHTPEGYRNFAMKYPHGARAVEAEKMFRTLASDQLNVAASEGDLQQVQHLLAMDLDVNHETENGTTPLMWASLKGHSDIVDILLQNGALVNDHTDEGVTALMLAAQSNWQAVVETLLRHGADPNLNNIRDETAMDLAARENNTKILNTLLEVAIPLGEETSPSMKPPSTKILVSGIEQVVRKSAPELRTDQELDVDILAVSHFDSLAKHIRVYSRVALRHDGQWVPLQSIRHFKVYPLPNSEWRLEMVTANDLPKVSKGQDM